MVSFNAITRGDMHLPFSAYRKSTQRLFLTTGSEMLNDSGISKLLLISLLPSKTSECIGWDIHERIIFFSAFRFAILANSLRRTYLFYNPGTVLIGTDSIHQSSISEFLDASSDVALGDADFSR
jgi:hypothetical protein